MIDDVIYDCDGVIVQSEAAIISYYTWLSEKCGINPPDLSDYELTRKLLSYTENDIIDILTGGDYDLKEKMINIIKTEKYDGGFKDILLDDTVTDGLKLLKDMGVYAAVDTNRGASLPDLLTYFRIKDYFGFWVTSRDVKEPKPAPEGIYKICDYFNISPANALFIGDSPADYYAAKSSGAVFVSYKKPLFDAPVISNHRDITKFFA